MGLPGPLSQGNAEIDRLLIGSVLKTSEFQNSVSEAHHANSKGSKRVFYYMATAKEIIKRCLLPYSITKHHYLQGVAQRVLKE